MSRSRRKTPVFGHTTCHSERQDKKIWHQRWRTCERNNLASTPNDAWDEHLPLLENQVSNVWAMGKDGHFYCPTARQVIMAEQIATRQGRNPQERSSLKKRLMGSFQKTENKAR